MKEKCSNKWLHNMETISGTFLGINYCYSVCRDCGKTIEEINNLNHERK